MKKLVSLLLALCMMCSAMVAVAEENAVTEGKQEVHLSNATFLLDSDLVTTLSEDIGFQGENERYWIVLYCLDWANMGIDITLSGDEQYDNLFYCSYGLFNADATVTRLVADTSLRMDCAMLNGDEVMLSTLADGMVLLSHYYRGTGFIIILNGKEGYAQEELTEVAFEIARSFRLDGVSEEDMIADARAD